MATADMPVTVSTSQPAIEPMIQRSPMDGLSYESFNPKKHIDFTPPPRVYSMSDIGLPEDTGISPVAVSEPFQLFTAEAILRMRSEVLSDHVWANYRYSSTLAQCQLRGFASAYAPFVYDVWKHPETLAIISKIAGVELTTAMDFEIGHINISVKSEKQRVAELNAIEGKISIRTNKDVNGCSWEDEKPIVDWHTDSYPFVCVTMLSDCTSMVGGETALRTGNGDIMKVRGPQMGCAVVLQGRYIKHQALRALGTTERITMVTSFRPRSPALRDDTVLTTVRAVSNLSELYLQFSEYRLDILEERIRNQLKQLRETKSGSRKWDTMSIKNFLKEQEVFLAHTNREIVEEEQVLKGIIDDSHLLTCPTTKGSSKRLRVD